MPVTPTSYVEHDTAVATWTGETGVSLPYWSSRFIANCIQVIGTGTLSVTGSNDNTTYYPLHDALNANTVLTGITAGLHEILENPIWIRIEVTTGTASAILVLRTAA